MCAEGRGRWWFEKGVLSPFMISCHWCNSDFDFQTPQRRSNAGASPMIGITSSNRKILKNDKPINKNKGKGVKGVKGLKGLQRVKGENRSKGLKHV